MKNITRNNISLTSHLLTNFGRLCDGNVCTLLRSLLRSFRVGGLFSISSGSGLGGFVQEMSELSFAVRIFVLTSEDDDVYCYHSLRVLYYGIVPGKNLLQFDLSQCMLWRGQVFSQSLDNVINKILL